MMDKSPAWLSNAAFDNMFARKMNNFVDHCLYDEPSLAPGEDGLAVQRMLDGLYRSADMGGREVEIGG